MAAPVIIETAGPDETRALGADLGRLAEPCDCILLHGELGAGKTTFVQGLAAGLDVAQEYITSPTFSIVNEYEGRHRLYHVDLYRLSGPDDLADVGLSEYLGTGVTAVEWPERAGDELPPEALDVSIETTGAEARRITLLAHGKRYESLLEEICRNPRWSGL